MPRPSTWSSTRKAPSCQAPSQKAGGSRTAMNFLGNLLRAIVEGGVGESAPDGGGVRVKEDLVVGLQHRLHLVPGETHQVALGLTLREGYGQTETTLLLANLRDEDSRAGSLGRPSPMYHIELLGKDGKPVPDGEIGEVCIVPKDGKRPLGVFCAYLDNEERYQEVWRGGVYHTGDAVWRDEDGYYWFHGRFDDIIKSGGFRIGPYEVENVLMKHPAVAECSVIGVPDKLRGQAIKAVIVPAPGYEPSRQLDKEIREFCNSELAEYKWVRLIEFVDEMPKTISGKIRKARLQEQNAQTA